MIAVLIALVLTLQGVARSRSALHLEVLALRHQLLVLQRSRPQRLRLVKAVGSGCGCPARGPAGEGR